MNHIVTMARNIQIIRIQSVITLKLHLATSETKFLPWVDRHQVAELITLLLNYLTLIPTHGRRKLHFHTANLGEFILLSYWPLHGFRISRYGLINRKSSVLILGGICDNEYNYSSIAQYTNDKWEHVGNLQRYRYAYRAVANDDRVYVVGGYGGEL